MGWREQKGCNVSGKYKGVGRKKREKVWGGERRKGLGGGGLEEEKGKEM